MELSVTTILKGFAHWGLKMAIFLLLRKVTKAKRTKYFPPSKNFFIRVLLNERIVLIVRYGAHKLINHLDGTWAEHLVQAARQTTCTKHSDKIALRAEKHSGDDRTERSGKDPCEDSCPLFVKFLSVFLITLAAVSDHFWRDVYLIYYYELFKLPIQSYILYALIMLLVILYPILMGELTEF